MDQIPLSFIGILDMHVSMCDVKVANSKAWSGTWSGRNERHWKIDSVEDFVREIEAKSWSLGRMSCAFITVIPLQNPPDWQEILANFRGSELQNYFTKILEDNLRVRGIMDFLTC